MALFFLKELIAQVIVQSFLFLLIIYNAEGRKPPTFCPTLGSSRHWIDQADNVIIAYDDSTTGPLCGVKQADPDCQLDLLAHQGSDRKRVGDERKHFTGSFELKKGDGACCLEWSPHPCNFSLMNEITSTSNSPTPTIPFDSKTGHPAPLLAAISLAALALSTVGIVVCKVRPLFRRRRLQPESNDVRRDYLNVADSRNESSRLLSSPRAENESDQIRGGYHSTFSINANRDDVFLPQETTKDKNENKKADIDFSLKGISNHSDNFLSICISSSPTINLYKSESQSDVIGEEGGTIRLPRSGIELIVPPNAIKGKSCLLTLRLYGRKRIVLPSKRTAVLEIIEVLPDTRKFEKNVLIRRPLKHYHKCSGTGFYSFFYGAGSNCAEVYYDYMGTVRSAGKRSLYYETNSAVILEDDSYQIHTSKFCYFATIFEIDSFGVTFQMFAEKGIEDGDTCEWTLKPVISCSCPEVVRRTEAKWKEDYSFEYKGRWGFTCQNRHNVERSQRLDVVLSEKTKEYDSWEMEPVTFTGEELIETVMGEEDRSFDKGGVVYFRGNGATTDKIKRATFRGKIFVGSDKTPVNSSTIRLSDIGGRLRQRDDSLQNLTKEITNPDRPILVSIVQSSSSIFGGLNAQATAGGIASPLDDSEFPEPPELAREIIPINDLMDVIATIARGSRDKCLMIASKLNMMPRARELENRSEMRGVMRIVLEGYKDQHGESKARQDFVEACKAAELGGALTDKVREKGYSMPRND